MPFIVPFIPLIAAGAGTAVQAIGQVKAGNAAQREAEFNAQTAELNAQRAIEAGEFNAAAHIEAAGIREGQQRYADRVAMARGRALVGASGVDVTSGSPLDVMAENARQAELDALIIRRGGALEAETSRKSAALEAEAQRRQAQAFRLGGKNAKTASRYGAAGSLLTGGYQVAKGVQDTIRLGGSGGGGYAGGA